MRPRPAHDVHYAHDGGTACGGGSPEHASRDLRLVSCPACRASAPWWDAMLRQGRSQVDSAESREKAWALTQQYALLLRRMGLHKRYGVRLRLVPGHRGTWGIHVELHDGAS